MRSEIIEATQIGIATILKNFTLHVDPHQREYSWGRREVTQLFQDLYRAIDENEETYFLGSIVTGGRTVTRGRGAFKGDGFPMLTTPSATCGAGETSLGTQYWRTQARGAPTCR